MTATAGERPVAVRPLHLVVEEYWPERVAGSMAGMSSDTLATIEVSEGFDLLPGESRRFDFSVTVPLGARVTRGRARRLADERGLPRAGPRARPAGEGRRRRRVRDGAAAAYRWGRAEALTGAGFFARPVENRRRPGLRPQRTAASRRGGRRRRDGARPSASSQTAASATPTTSGRSRGRSPRDGVRRPRKAPTPSSSSCLRAPRTRATKLSSMRCRRCSRSRRSASPRTPSAHRLAWSSPWSNHG